MMPKLITFASLLIGGRHLFHGNAEDLGGGSGMNVFIPLEGLDQHLSRERWARILSSIWE